MQVVSKVIATSAITEAKIATSAVTEGKIGSGAVTEGKIGSGAVTSTKLGSDSVDGTKIADSAISSEHLASAAKQSVLESKLERFYDLFENFSAGSSTSADCTDKAYTAASLKKTGGSSSVKGLVTTAPHNKCLVRNASNGDNIQDTLGRLVFGRQTVTKTSKTGTLVVTNGSPNIVGTDTLFTSELAVGQYIELDSEGVAYKVETITDDTHLALSINYGGTNASGAAYSRSVMTLSYYVDVSGTETAHTMSGETIDVQIPESLDLYSAPFGAFSSGIAFAEPFPADHTHSDYVFYDRQENKTIVTLNAIPDLTYTPKAGTGVVMFFGGINQRNGTDFTVSTKAVTWSSVNAGFDLEVGDIVYFKYLSTD